MKPEEVPPNANFVCLLDCEFGPFSEKKKEENGGVPDSIFAPPYAVNSAGGQRNLSEKTLPVSARHPKTGALEYDAHNLYGHSMSKATFEALSEVNNNKMRPFLYTRSSFLGTGAFSGHWTGDTSSSWRDLRRLTPSVLLSGLALIPFVGGDVGGFMNGASSKFLRSGGGAKKLFSIALREERQRSEEASLLFSSLERSGSGAKNLFSCIPLRAKRSDSFRFSILLLSHLTSPHLNSSSSLLFSLSLLAGELAERWIAAASLHPFFRFHHAQGFQEPFRRFAGSGSGGGGGGGNETSDWGPVRDAARLSLGLRYRLLPTLYSAAAQAAATGCPTARPLWFSWPASEAAREQAGLYGVGDSLVVAPALEPGVGAVEVSLPSGTGVSFFDFYTRKRISGGVGAFSSSSPSSSSSVVVSLPAPRGKPPPLLVVAGGVVAVAGEEAQGFSTTSAARAAPLTIIAALPAAERKEEEEEGEGATTLRCGRSCKKKGSACGDLYLDKGEELDPGPYKRGRTLSVDASSTSVRLSWPVPAGRSSSSNSERCETVPWPKLSKIVVLGAGRGDSVSSSPPSPSPVVFKARVTSPSGGAKPKVDASLDAETGALELTIGGSGGGLQLKCGEDFEVEWR